MTILFSAGRSAAGSIRARVAATDLVTGAAMRARQQIVKQNTRAFFAL
jgi:hypothetical protein